MAVLLRRKPSLRIRNTLFLYCIPPVLNWKTGCSWVQDEVCLHPYKWYTSCSGVALITSHFISIVLRFWNNKSTKLSGGKRWANLKLILTSYSVYYSAKTVEITVLCTFYSNNSSIYMDRLTERERKFLEKAIELAAKEWKGARVDHSGVCGGDGRWNNRWRV